jgi:hypothetical protein
MTYLCVDPLLSMRCVFHMTIEVDRQHVFWAGLFPWITKPQPIIRLFCLTKELKTLISCICMSSKQFPRHLTKSKHVTQKQRRTWEESEEEVLWKTQIDEEAWLINDIHRGLNEEGGRRSVVF